MHDLLLRCFQTETDDMLPMLEEDLEALGYKPERHLLHMLAPGTVPILLVAHVDTVHFGMPETIYHDENKGCLWSPDGLGADDRAGVWGIMEILHRGYRPWVLFTDEEETGGHGATQATKMWDAPDVRLLVQLDRMNDKDAVWYDCDNGKAERWVNKHGFKTAQGSFSDISILCPDWHIAGVNLSIGYYRQHTTAEHLSLPEAEATIDKVCTMLDNPPEKRFQYHAKKQSWSYFDNRLPTHYQAQTPYKLSTQVSHLEGDMHNLALDIDQEMCEGCDTLTDAHEMILYHGDSMLCKNCAKEVGLIDRRMAEKF